jgi:predicted RNA binding protein YcfA (HicA-like mRNA interferase family)
MPRLPILKAREVIHALEKAGFKRIRQKGSHVFMQHSNGNTTLIPLYSGRDIDRALPQKIIADTRMTQKEFVGLL